MFTWPFVHSGLNRFFIVWDFLFTIRLRTRDFLVISKDRLISLHMYIRLVEQPLLRRSSLLHQSVILYISFLLHNSCMYFVCWKRMLLETRGIRTVFLPCFSDLTFEKFPFLPQNKWKLILWVRVTVYNLSWPGLIFVKFTDKGKKGLKIKSMFPCTCLNNVPL